MKNKVACFMEKLEGILKQTNTAFKKMTKSKTTNFNFFYKMENEDIIEFYIHYQEDNRTVPQFHVNCFIESNKKMIFHSDPNFLLYCKKHPEELHAIYQHFINCFHREIKQNIYFRLHDTVHADMIINNIEKTYLGKLSM